MNERGQVMATYSDYLLSCLHCIPVICAIGIIHSISFFFQNTNTRIREKANSPLISPLMDNQITLLDAYILSRNDAKSKKG